MIADPLDLMALTEISGNKHRHRFVFPLFEFPFGKSVAAEIRMSVVGIETRRICASGPLVSTTLAVNLPLQLWSRRSPSRVLPFNGML